MCLAGDGGGKGRLKKRSGVELTEEEDTEGDEVLKRLGNGLNRNDDDGDFDGCGGGVLSGASSLVIERLCFDWCSMGFP